MALSVLLRPVFPVIEYVVNYDYIANVLCVNKEKPKMHCNGKCHLMKELAKAAESEKPTTPDKKHTNIESFDWFFDRPLEYSFLNFNQNQGTSYFQYNNLYAHLSVQGIFHPPTFSA
ncbi:hypothetical protein KIH23_00190 [Flavobacterium sp. CYK-55]|nr:hypothetical protein [Flavobacterium sp. CYK-55]